MSVLVAVVILEGYLKSTSHYKYTFISYPQGNGREKKIKKIIGYTAWNDGGCELDPALGLCDYIYN